MSNELTSLDLVMYCCLEKHRWVPEVGSLSELEHDRSDLWH